MSPSEVHLWIEAIELTDGAKLAEAWSLLNEAERTRAARFLVPRARLEYMLSHALIRRALSSRSGVDPRDFVFRTGPFGKPFIAEPLEHVSLRFNMSHSHGLLACAVCKDTEVGVDVEHTGADIDMMEVAREVMSPAELEVFQRTPERRQRKHFYAIWTLKEAFMKAKGEGFHLTPSRIELTLGPQGEVENATLDRAPILSRWAFYRFWPTPEHAGALVAPAGSKGLVLMSTPEKAAPASAGRNGPPSSAGRNGPPSSRNAPPSSAGRNAAPSSAV